MTDPDPRDLDEAALRHGEDADYMEVGFTSRRFVLLFGNRDEHETTMRTRVVLNPTRAVTLVEMLQSVIQRYEKLVGPIAREP